MNTTRKFFFAIPFDAATRNMYARVCDAIRRQYPNVTTVIGSDEVGPSPEYSTIASFKDQNRELNRQFVSQIRDADVVIADLTHNNPNVHVELGMALLHNKNILRVTGRPLSELGFDIRNLHVHAYRAEDDLIKTITSYCDLFLKIKSLPISDQYATLYFSEPAPVSLDSSKNILFLHPLGRPVFPMRDGAVRVRFEFVSADTENDWFGVYFRVGTHPFWGSHLVYVRKNGEIEVAVYPGPQILGGHRQEQPAVGKLELVVEFENNHVHITMGNVDFQSDVLSLQTVGSVALAAWNARVDVASAEMICRDTIASE